MPTGTKTIFKKVGFFFVFPQPTVEIKKETSQSPVAKTIFAALYPADNKDVGYHRSAPLSPAISTKK